MTDLSTRLLRASGALLLMIGLFWWQARSAKSLPSWPAEPTTLIPATIGLAKTEPPQISAFIGYAYALDSGTVLFDKNSSQAWPPASTAKLLTALTAQAIYSPETILTVDATDLNLPERPLFTRGEELLVKDLIEAMLVSSSNQAAYILANHAPGGKAGFLADLNSLATDLDLNQTEILDPAGFDTIGQTTSAQDLVKVAKVVMADETLKSYVSLSEAEVAEFNGVRSLKLKSTNQLLAEEPTVIGIKTGTTAEAGQILLSQYHLDPEDIVVVVMGSEDRYADTKALMSWIQDNYGWFAPDQLARAETSDSLIYLNQEL